MQEPVDHSSSTEELVTYDRSGQVASITLNRPGKMNAFNDAMVLALKGALVRFDRDDEAHVAVLSGAGRCFSTGADVKERQLRSREEMLAYGGPEHPDARWGDLLYNSVQWKPVVAAVHGYALGLALGLSLQCDLAVATPDAKLQITETARGLHGSRYWGLLRYRGAGAFADQVALTGEFFTGQQAYDRGVVNSLAEPGELLDHANALARRVATNPPLAVRANVRARRADMKRFEDSLEPYRIAQPALHLSEAFGESARAFASRRAMQGQPEVS